MRFQMPHGAKLKLIEDWERISREKKLVPLSARLEDFQECVKAFAKTGFLKKALGMGKHTKTLAKVDKQITTLLESATLLALELTQVEARSLGLRDPGGPRTVEELLQLGAKATEGVDGEGGKLEVDPLAEVDVLLVLVLLGRVECVAVFSG